MQKQLHQNIKSLRKRHQLTQKEMAEQLNISERTYQRFENGEQKGINLIILEHLCRILSITVEDLFHPPTIS